MSTIPSFTPSYFSTTFSTEGEKSFQAHVGADRKERFSNGLTAWFRVALNTSTILYTKPEIGDPRCELGIPPSTVARVAAVATAVFTLGIPMFLMAAAGAAIRKLGGENSTWKQMQRKTEKATYVLPPWQRKELIASPAWTTSESTVPLYTGAPEEIKKWVHGMANPRTGAPSNTVTHLRILAANAFHKELGGDISKTDQAGLIAVLKANEEFIEAYRAAYVSETYLLRWEIAWGLLNPRCDDLGGGGKGNPWPYHNFDGTVKS